MFKLLFHSFELSFLLLDEFRATEVILCFAEIRFDRESFCVVETVELKAFVSKIFFNIHARIHQAENTAVTQEGWLFVRNFQFILTLARVPMGVA